MDRKTHVKQDEWAYPSSNPKSRAKIKRGRQKAKRRLAKKEIDEQV
jgi:hypothetical protein